MRDNFSRGVKDILAHRAGYRCSKPDCRAATAGPSWKNTDARSSAGVAAHITAAAPGGPRFDETLTREDRSSASNGIWLCQVHAKLIDDDPNSYPIDVLNAWKEHAEHLAKALLGRPVSAQALDVAVEISLQRNEDGGLVAVGTTNLPSGTKLLLRVTSRSQQDLLGTPKAEVFDRHFVSQEVRGHGGTELRQDWYSVVVLSYFNGPWRQPRGVIEIAGPNGIHLVGPHAVPIDPDVEDSHTRFEASFECLAPPATGDPPLEDREIRASLPLLLSTKLRLPSGTATTTVGETVRLFTEASDLAEKDGWSTQELLPGLVEVRYSFWNGPHKEAVAVWHVIPRCEAIRYRNRHGKHMSGTTTGD